MYMYMYIYMYIYIFIISGIDYIAPFSTERGGFFSILSSSSITGTVDGIYRLRGGGSSVFYHGYRSNVCITENK